jgi:hypothetical protein
MLKLIQFKEMADDWSAQARTKVADCDKYSNILSIIHIILYNNLYFNLFIDLKAKYHNTQFIHATAAFIL